jgi:hypothetical protein
MNKARHKHTPHTNKYVQVLKISGISAEWRQLHNRMLYSILNMTALMAVTKEIKYLLAHDAVKSGK